MHLRNGSFSDQVPQNYHLIPILLYLITGCSNDTASTAPKPSPTPSHSLSSSSSPPVSEQVSSVDCDHPNMVIAVTILPGKNTVDYKAFAAPNSRLNPVTATLMTVNFNTVDKPNEEKFETSIETDGAQLSYCSTKILTRDKFVKLESAKSKAGSSFSKKFMAKRGTPVMFYLSDSSSRPGPNDYWTPSKEEIRTKPSPSPVTTA